MRVPLRSTVGVVTALTISLGSAGPTSAATVAPQLLDVTKQVGALQAKFAELNAKGGTARAGLLTAFAACGTPRASAAFSAWGDGASYVLAPGGDFASPVAWLVNDHAAVDAAPSPSGDDRVLSLEDGGEAVSPVICIRADHPTIRLFARNTGAADSRLEVSVLYEDTDGHVKELRVARLLSGSAWSPTTVIPIYVNLLATYSPDGITPVAIRFKATGVKSRSGRWQLDDLYVDPWKGH
jgi:hypothetical protein